MRALNGAVPNSLRGEGGARPLDQEGISEIADVIAVSLGGGARADWRRIAAVDRGHRTIGE